VHMFPTEVEWGSVLLSCLSCHVIAFFVNYLALKKKNHWVSDFAILIIP
jgi:hypothetical protein